MVYSRLDMLLSAADDALRTVFAHPVATRPLPAAPAQPDDQALPEEERDLSEALMRVNHVGEVCAQALYAAQAFGSHDPAMREALRQAGREEMDHLAWTRQRLDELGGRASVLNPLWYAGAFAVGLVAARLGDAKSLGFLRETERQVEQHLSNHMDRLPERDRRSRAIVERMRDDEAAHAEMAERAGAAELPAPARWLMRAAAKVMTTTAHRV
jgi:ubiquinone biosynthesis monooxygenase Coq7